MQKTARLLTALAFTATLATTLAAPAAAWGGHWRAAHPRRAEVNARLFHQQRRITEERREGELSGAQARELRAEDRGIRREERQMARLNGGRLTGAEYRALNQQENAVGQQIPR